MVRLLVLLCGLLAGFAQSSSAQACGSARERFRIELTTGERVMIRNMQVDDTTVSGIGPKGAAVSFALDDIRAVERCKGTWVYKGVRIGAFTGLALFIVYAIADVSTDPHYERDGSLVIPGMLVTVGGGGLIGAAIGFSTPRWLPMDYTGDWTISGGSATPSLTLSFRF